MYRDSVVVLIEFLCAVVCCFFKQYLPKEIIDLKRGNIYLVKVRLIV